MTGAEVVRDVRVEVDDNNDPTVAGLPLSHFFRGEPAIGLVNGTNAAFRSRHYPIIANGFGSGVHVQATNENDVALAITSVDLARGIVTLTTAPASGQVRLNYYAEFASDEQYRTWLNQALRWVGAASISALTATISVGDSLAQALITKTKARYYETMATKSADFFDFSAGGKTENKAAVPAQWAALAKEANLQAEKDRDDVYKRQGRQFAPSFDIGTSQGIRPYTPTR